MEKIELSGKEFDVIGYAKVVDEDGSKCGEIPIVDVHMVSDFKWQMDCLESRLDNPDSYKEDEDVEETVMQIEAWCDEHVYQAIDQELEKYRKIKKRITEFLCEFPSERWIKLYE